jgi:hypothetical protein
MRNAFVAALLGVLVAACGDSGPAITEPEQEIQIREVSEAALSAAGLGGDAVHSLRQRLWLPALRGSEEVPPRETRALGAALLVAARDDGSLGYVLAVARINNVVQAHIHVGARGTNGPVVAFLFGPVPPGGGRARSILATGEITDADLVGPLVGMTVADLLAEIRSGNAYVNVHTNDGVDPPNTGPGDFPGGEIRGQIGHTHN